MAHVFETFPLPEPVKDECFSTWHAERCRRIERAKNFASMRAGSIVEVNDYTVVVSWPEEK